MDKAIQSIYRLALNGYTIRSVWDEWKYIIIQVYMPKNHASVTMGNYDVGWNEVAKFDTLDQLERIEEDNKYRRYQGIKDIYRFVLIDGWYVTVFHDKFYTDHMCFLMRSPDCTKRDMVRLPL